MILTPEEEKISNEAEQFARSKKLEIARSYIAKAKCEKHEAPLSVFMAGSPGAGKTEISKRIADYFASNENIGSLLRIDPDDIRTYLPGYSGGNSYLFQGAISFITEKIHDLALEKKYHFILDGTLSREQIAVKNIDRSLRKNRVVFILFVYTDPFKAWEFTKARELKEGRKILKETFINQYFDSQHTFKVLNEKFNGLVSNYVFIRDFENVESVEIKENINAIDDILPKRYTRDELDKLLQ